MKNENDGIVLAIKEMKLVVYVLLYVLIVSVFLIFPTHMKELGLLNEIDAKFSCSYTNILLINSFWDNHPCQLSFISWLMLIVPFIIFYSLFIIVLSKLRRSIWNHRNNTLSEWIIISFIYSTLIALRTNEFNELSLLNTIKIIIGGLVMFSPFLLYNIIKIIIRKIKHRKNQVKI